MFNTIDLFSGAGGLSHGFCQTGNYKIVAAFENNPKAQETYKKNHPETEMYSDVCQADYNELKNKYGNIDIVIGGPPCQGFSNANRQKNTAVSQNNKLVKQYVRAITELRPKAFVMENVSMLKSDVHRFYVEKSEVELLDKYGIKRTESEIVLISSQFFKEEYINLVQSEELLNTVNFSEEDYKFLKVLMRQKGKPDKFQNVLKKHQKSINSIVKKIEESESEFVKTKFELLKNIFIDISEEKADIVNIISIIEEALALIQMIKTAKEIFDNDIFIDSYDVNDGISVKVQSYPVFDYVKQLLESDDFGYSFTSGVLCAADFGAPQKRNRFVVIGVKKEFSEDISMPVGKYSSDNYRTVYDAIGDLELVRTCCDISEDCGACSSFEYNQSDNLFNELHDSELIYNHVITATRDNALKRFEALKPGQNFHSLDNELKVNTFSNIERTQNTIYQRLDYSAPSGTVLNVRKSMWIHPSINRAVSIREAARLQTFPDSFIFCGTKDSQYQQVGNAVPPILAKSIAEHINNYLK